ncbi:MAG TPA: SLC13 family permease [Paracoccaceae bacterium]|nr:SLC13 family permease [Paracoccaceae bacterium]
MTPEIAIVLMIAVTAMVLFVTEALRMDVVALLVLGAVAVLGLVSPEEAFSGFSNQATVTVAAMFILAAGLQNTGALSGIGGLLGRSRSPTMFLVTLFGLLAVIAPFVNNTAVVAVFMPIVIASALRVKMPPTKALIPLSYVAQMTGVCTLIGTSTNLLVNSIAQDLGHRGFTMFEFLPLGAACLVAGCIYLLTAGRWLLPSTGDTDLSAIRESGVYVTELLVTEQSKLRDSSAEIRKLSEDYRVYVLELWRGDQRLWAPRSEKLREGDVLLVRGKLDNLQKLHDELQLEFEGEAEFDEGQDEQEAPADETSGNGKNGNGKNGNGNGEESRPKRQPAQESRVMAEVMIAPNSTVSGHRLGVLDRGLSTNAAILGVQRRGEVIRSQLDNLVLKVGDILLLVTWESHLARLRQDKNFIVLSTRDAPTLKGWQAPFALATMALVVILPAIGILPIAVSAAVGAAAMVLAGCLAINDMYDEIDWKIVFVMAGLLPLGLAMSSSGAAGYIVDHTVGLVSSFGPHIVLAVLYLMALLLGEMMSNSAAAVLLTPIGISTAEAMGTDATPFLIAITFSASTSFLTPVGYQTNTMVYSAGGYRFSDFIKVGLPLNLIFWGLGVALIPIFWPF